MKANKKMQERSLPGINIQWPISELILSGAKIIETRTYPIPRKFIGVDMALIETPGKKGHFKARIRGVIKFGPSFKYSSKAAFYRDSSKHCVTPEGEWKWEKKPKWGWPVEVIEVFDTPKAPPGKKGIVYAQNCQV